MNKSSLQKERKAKKKKEGENSTTNRGNDKILNTMKSL